MSKTYFFRSRATQAEPIEPLPTRRIPIGRDMLLIKTRFFKVGRQSICGRDMNVFPELVVDAQMMVPLTRLRNSYQTRRGYSKIMPGYLSKMGIPTDEHHSILRNVFEVVGEAVPGLPITVIIVEVEEDLMTYHNSKLAAKLSYRQLMLDEVAWEFMETLETSQQSKGLLFLARYLEDVTKMVKGDQPRTLRLKSFITKLKCFNISKIFLPCT